MLALLGTNLHACLLIISLACLHDVESQAKLLASSSHHCLWCLSKLAWPIPGHPLTLDLSSTWFFCMYVHFFFLFLFFLYRNVTGGREVKQINVKTYLRSIHLRDLFFCLFFCDCFSPCECFKKKKKKPVGFLILNFLLFFHVAFFLPLSVKFTWKLNTGIGTQLCYLVPLAICWLLKKKKKTCLQTTFQHFWKSDQ